MSGNIDIGNIPNGEAADNHHHDGDAQQQQQQQQHTTVSPEMLFKISKKIAQLTKVIYSLNTRNDDLELELGQVRASYEERLRRSKSNPVISGSNGSEPEDNGEADQVGNRKGGGGGDGGEGANGRGSKKRRSKTPEASDSDTRRELRKARHIMRHLESKMKVMEEERRKALEEQAKAKAKEAAKATAASTAAEEDKSSRDRELRPISKEKQQLEWTRKLDHLEVKNEHLRLEKEHFRKAAEEATRENSDLQIQLSAARVQLMYHDQTPDGAPPPNFARSNSLPATAEEKNNSNSNSNSNSKHVMNDNNNTKREEELLEQVEKLNKEREDLVREVQATKAQQERQRKHFEAMKQQQEQMSKFAAQTATAAAEKQKVGATIEVQEELLRLRREKVAAQTALDDARAKHEREAKQLMDDKRKMFVEIETLKNSQEVEARKQRALWDRREEEVARARAEASEAARLRDRLKETEGEAAGARAETDSLRRRLEEREGEGRRWDEERERRNKEVCEWKRREEEARRQLGSASEAVVAAEESKVKVQKECDELKRKWREMELKVEVSQRKERDLAKEGDQKARGLERALEEALSERQEILEAAAKEIDHVRTIAMRTEQKMMDDFEWKLREIESEGRTKAQDAERQFEARAAAARREYESKKDAEFMRLSIGLRREMEDQMRVERVNLRQALEAKALQEKEVAAGKFQLEKDRALRYQQKSWEEERNTLQREKRSLQRRFDDATQKAEKVAKEVREEEKTKLQEAREQTKRECQRMREEAAAQAERLKKEHRDAMKELETRLESANSNRFSSMFQMKEEVETEFTERMEALRGIYKTEIEGLTEKLEEEKERAREQETTLRETIAQQKSEIDDLNAYCAQSDEDHQAKVEDLLTRLQEQTTLAQRLQGELDEYEYYEEDEEGNMVEKAPDAKVALERQAQEVMAGKRPQQNVGGGGMVSSALATATAAAAATAAASASPTHLAHPQRNASGGSSSGAKTESTSSATTTTSFSSSSTAAGRTPSSSSSSWHHHEGSPRSTYANPFRFLYNYGRRRKY